MKKLLLVTLMTTTITANAENVTLNAKPNPASWCRVGTTCNVSAEHSTRIQNTSSETRTYKVTYQICADNGDCSKQVYNVPIATNHIWNDVRVINLFTNFNRARPHQIDYWTTVTSPWINQQYHVSNNIDVK